MQWTGHEYEYLRRKWIEKYVAQHATICMYQFMIYLYQFILVSKTNSFSLQVKDDLGSVKYNQLLQAFEKYAVDDDYGLCSESLFGLYSEDNFSLIKALTNLTKFLKPEHCEPFETAVKQKL